MGTLLKRSLFWMNEPRVITFSPMIEVCGVERWSWSRCKIEWLNGFENLVCTSLHRLTLITCNQPIMHCMRRRLPRPRWWTICWLQFRVKHPFCYRLTKNWIRHSRSLALLQWRDQLIGVTGAALEWLCSYMENRRHSMSVRGRHPKLWH